MILPALKPRRLDGRNRRYPRYSYRIDFDTDHGIKDTLRYIDYMLAFTELYGQQPHEWLADVKQRSIYYQTESQLTAVKLKTQL